MSEILVKSEVDAEWNPSYPQRVHVREAGCLHKRLSEWVRRVDDAAARGPSQVGTTDAPRILAQMRGACDQVADAARRIPTEVGHPYEEGLQRMREAEHALERLLARW